MTVASVDLCEVGLQFLVYSILKTETVRLSGSAFILNGIGIGIQIGIGLTGNGKILV